MGGRGLGDGVGAGDTADLKNIHFSLKLCHLPFYKAKVATLPVARFLRVLGGNVGEKVQHEVLQLGGFQAALTGWRALTFGEQLRGLPAPCLIVVLTEEWLRLVPAPHPPYFFMTNFLIPPSLDFGTVQAL